MWVSWRGFIKIFHRCLLQCTTLLLYICARFWLLAHESRDLSQAETKITFVKNRTSSQNGNYFHSKWWFFSNLTISTEKKLICSACNKNYFCLSLRYMTWFMSQQIKTNTDVEHDFEENTMRDCRAAHQCHLLSVLTNIILNMKIFFFVLVHLSSLCIRVWPKQIFWFRTDTATETQIGIYFRPIP